MINSALSWLERGFAVFPLKPRDKRPLGSLVPNGLKDASRDPAVIRDWWRRAPQANIGVITGGGTFVVDLDGPEAKSAWADMCGRNGDVPKTLCTKTARGWHMFFSAPQEIPNSASRLGPKIDIRGAGGYVVAAPSVHPDGPIYTILRDLPIAEAPRWIIDLAMPDERPEPAPAPMQTWRSANAKLAAVPSILVLVTRAREGERNAIVFWAGCRFGEMVAERLIGEQEAGGLLVEAAMCAGLISKEAIATVRSAFRQGARR